MTRCLNVTTGNAFEALVRKDVETEILVGEQAENVEDEHANSPVGLGPTETSSHTATTKLNASTSSGVETFDSTLLRGQCKALVPFQEPENDGDLSHVSLNGNAPFSEGAMMIPIAADTGETSEPLEVNPMEMMVEEKLSNSENIARCNAPIFHDNSTNVYLLDPMYAVLYAEDDDVEVNSDFEEDKDEGEIELFAGHLLKKKAPHLSLPLESRRLTREKKNKNLGEDWIVPVKKKKASKVGNVDNFGEVEPNL